MDVVDEANNKAVWSCLKKVLKKKGDQLCKSCARGAVASSPLIFRLEGLAGF